MTLVAAFVNFVWALWCVAATLGIIILIILGIIAPFFIASRFNKKGCIIIAGVISIFVFWPLVLWICTNSFDCDLKPQYLHKPKFLQID